MKDNKLEKDNWIKNGKENLEENENRDNETVCGNDENQNLTQNNEIIKKILEALHGQNYNNNSINTCEERLSDPRKKGK